MGGRRLKIGKRDLPCGFSGRVVFGCLYHERQARQVIIVSLCRVNEEVEGLVGAVNAPRLLQLEHQLTVLLGAIPPVDLEPA